jgi:signal transduction histidine kinase
VDWGSIDRGSVDEGSIDRGSVDEGSIDRGSVDEGSIDRDSVDRGIIDCRSAAWGSLVPGGAERPPARRRGLAAPLALPAGFFALLLVGAIAAATHGAESAGWVLGLAAAIVAAGSAVAEIAAAPVLAIIGWLTVIGFSSAPYAQLRPGDRLAAGAAILLVGCMLAGLTAGAIVRRASASFTLWVVEVSGPERQNQRTRRTRLADLGGRAHLTALAQVTQGVGGRRTVAGVLLLAAGLPLLTFALNVSPLRLDLGDDLLIYLVAVVAVAVVGGFWPALLAAVVASLLVNWFFTPPVHTLTIADGKSLLALLLFVTVAVTVSSVVHLAALRARQAARSSEEAADLLALAQTVLGGQDTPAAVLKHLTGSRGGQARLLERSGDQWVRVAGSADAEGRTQRALARPDLVLEVADQTRPLSPRLLDGLAAQAAAALDRDRLRTQAAQAEALAEGNRMRTALLAAVSHDLRTPLASIKASVSTLRQTDVEWTEADEAALLATIEASADRLDALIGNLLDMSRLTTGSLQPFLRPTAIDEVAPMALRGLDRGGVDSSGTDGTLRFEVPDGLPLVLTDPGLLERVLANLFANALAYSPDSEPPVLRARHDGDRVLLDVVDRGRGVPDELKDRMFEPFQRLDARGPDSSGGTGTGLGGAGVGGAGVGLGLAVVKGFVEIMGGTVTAADTPGGGLTMRVVLPCAAANAASIPAGS